MIQKLLQFVELTHKFNQLKRQIYATGEDRDETDSEHSFQLAMVCWYVIEKDQLPLDKNLVIKYALIHDLVEIFAGDVFAYEERTDVLQAKLKKEKEAVQRFAREIPEFVELNQLLVAYERRADSESKFVYAMDKLLPELNSYLDNGRSWKRFFLTFDQIQTMKRKKIQPFSGHIWEYYLELEGLINNNGQDLFGQ